MTDKQREEVMNALLKRAKGYTTCERVTEYGAGDDGEEAFLKRRETEKDVPGDVSAARLLLELDGQKIDSYAAYSDEKLAELCRDLASRLTDILNP